MNALYNKNNSFIPQLDQNKCTYNNRPSPSQKQAFSKIVQLSQLFLLQATQTDTFFHQGRAEGGMVHSVDLTGTYL